MQLFDLYIPVLIRYLNVDNNVLVGQVQEDYDSFLDTKL